ncbi:V-type ATP synthase subunit B [Picrophilus oshimae]|uniref:A-type ATP synthase subunit B n=1 Tax=Picrophilus torridus (strain ATCC 700027 / DSM 9790 / JCM 10055 / NBRC 100828 / KAW 2/3) TaxID=1122961 RepID=A0A8G2FW97_PICTO|nr:V-type ATP synthase subunit B [Picrophilus oshimae]SMD30619.1 V/A-type H+-transporting ATPase subunit B [Picrophilus oshimae DSM 9789]
MRDVLYRSVSQISGPLLFVEDVKDTSYNEIVDIILDNGEKRRGQVLETRNGLSIVQIYGSTTGISTSNASVKFTGSTFRLPVSDDMLGRIFNGFGEPIDNGPKIYSKDKLDINGSAINPYSREEPSEFVQTGISTIDGMNTLVMGQKLPIFSGAGLSHNRLAAQIARQAKTLKGTENFGVVFGAIGITSEEANYFINEFQSSGSLSNSVIFLNLASDPSMDRIVLPRIALTTAEYLAYEKEMNMLVILTDMTNYCEALREISSARNEIPGRRGYPGYMYTDLSTIYERAGKIRGRNGSITQIPILTMPGDDITNPVPDLTGYITEGQITLSRDLNKRNIYPEVDVLLSLSRLMNQGIGSDHTREDHRGLADQLYASYAKGKDARSMSEIVGEESLTETDKLYLKFAEDFENKYVNQGNIERSIEDTLNLGWDLLSVLPVDEMKKVKSAHIPKYGKWNNGK